MPLGHWDQPVQKFAPNRPDYALADRVGLGAGRWRSQHAQAQRPDRFVQMSCEDAVAIVEKVSITIPAADDFPQLLQRPCCGRMLCHVEVQQPTRAMLDEYEHIEQSECCRDTDKEVTCHNPPRVIVKKGRPALIAARATRRQLGRCQRINVSGRSTIKASRRLHSLANTARLTRVAGSIRSGLMARSLHRASLPAQKQVLCG